MFSTSRTSRALACLALAASAGSAAAQITAGPITNADNGHMYFVAKIASIAAYRSLAQSVSGYPVIINDATENQWIHTNLLPLVPAEYDSAYIGLSDEAVEGEWRWPHGMVDAYRNWQVNEPNSGPGQDYARMYRFNGRWDDFAGPEAGFVAYAIIEVGGGTIGEPNGIVYGPVRNPANGSDYYVLSPSYYDRAEEFAVNYMDGHLVSIDDAEENDFIARHVACLVGLGEKITIGLTDNEVEGTFKWHDGSTSPYRRWAPGEPNNDGGNEDYGVMYTAESPLLGFWNDEANFARPAIIEVKHCRGDFNESGAVTVQDIFDFLGAYFAGCP